MRERSSATVGELRSAIGCLPHATRVAMLEGIRNNEIVAGAYTHGEGICPMLAAHRAGGRTSFIGFARAWDRFAFRETRRGRDARRATERELLILRTHLEASLLEDDAPTGDLGAAIHEHQTFQAQRRREPVAPRPRARDRGRSRDRVRPGDPDRSRELGTRPGWGWMRVVRRYDDYQRALARLQEQDEALREPARP